MKLSFPSMSGLPREILAPIAAVALAFAAWALALSVWSGISDVRSSCQVQEKRFQELLKIVRQYKALPVKALKGSETQDPMVAVSTLIGAMGLKDNLIQISSMSKGLSVQLGRMYMERALDFIGEMEKRGLSVESSEMRAMPDQSGRLLSLTLIVTVES